MQGWISLSRKIQEHWLWTEKPFDKKSAWIDLLLMANHQDSKFMLGGQLIDVKRGDIVTSEIKLMNRWGWSKTKLRNFLKMLEKEAIIIKKSDKKKTALSIVNYSVYQDSKTTEKPLKDHKKTTEKLLKDTINNVNNENNDNNDNKEIYGDYVKLTKEQHEKLLKEYGQQVVDEYIERLNDYIGQIGIAKANKQYKSHYHVIKNWHRRDKQKKANITQKPHNKFINFKQREYDWEEIERLAKQKTFLK